MLIAFLHGLLPLPDSNVHCTSCFASLPSSEKLSDVHGLLQQFNRVGFFLTCLSILDKLILKCAYFFIIGQRDLGKHEKNSTF